MSHELTIRANGEAEMAYTGDVPWHRLGNYLEPGAPKKKWIEAAHFDFSVLAAEVLFNHGDAKHLGKMANRRVLYRSDNQMPLSIVSNGYKIVQPLDIMDYFDELVRRAGFVMETAGTLFGGKQFWALANIGDETTVMDSRDVVKGRLLLATSVDKTLATTAKFIAERVVCHNTLTFGMQETGGTMVKVAHSATFDAEQVNSKLGIVAHQSFTEQMAQFRRLAETPMEEADMIAATAHLIAAKADDLQGDGLVELMKSRELQRIGELALGGAIGSDLDGASGTAWGWLNSVTQYVDHEGGSKTDDGRLSKAWFGRGDRMKSRALQIAVDTANGDRSYTQLFDDGDGGNLLDQVLSLTAG